MNSLVATFDLWRFLTKPSPPYVRRAIRWHATVRDTAGLVNDLLPDPPPVEPRKEPES